MLASTDGGRPSSFWKEQEMWHRFLWGWLACWGLLAWPFVSVIFAPIVDLPQQVAQLRLWWGLSDSAQQSLYVSHAWFPNHLAYVFLGAGWGIGGALGAGRWGMWLIGGVWLGGLFALAWRLKRPIWMAALLGMSFFHFAMYWGFYSFLLGQAVFFGGLAWWLREPETRTMHAEIVGSGCLGILLYGGHVLWWGVALALVGLGGLRHGWRWRWRLIGLLPSCVLVGSWWAQWSHLEQTRRILWGWPWTARLSPSYMAHFSMGSVQGWLEPLYLWSVVALVVFGIVQSWLHKNEPRKPNEISKPSKPSGSIEAIGASGASGASEPSGSSEESWFNGRLLLCAAALWCLVLTLPSTYQRTAFLGERWMPSVFVLFALSWRSPRLTASLRWALPSLAWLVCVGFVGWTAWIWQHVERSEYDGMHSVLRTIPPQPTVLGIDLGRRSVWLKIHRPFLQGFAYTQVVHGGRLNDSFAGIPSSLVLFRPSVKKPWTEGLGWYPQRLQSHDLDHFSHIVVFGSQTQQHQFALRWQLLPLTHQGRWRLYLPPRSHLRSP